MQLTYTVKPIRAAGLEAKWTRTRKGAPIIVVRNPTAKLSHQQKWWWLDDKMFTSMEKDGVVEGFNRVTLLGDIFSI